MARKYMEAVMSKTLILASSLVLALGGAAVAADSNHDVRAKLDANKDGKITKAEAKSHKELSAKFSSLDTNKDGNLDSGEFAAFETADPNEKANPDVLDSTDDSVPGNKDLPGPGR